MHKKLTSLLASGALLAAGAAALGTGAASAAGTVQRYQMQTISITDTYAGGYVHNYTGSLNPCDGTFSGTGSVSDNHSETITGTYSNGVLTYTSTYDNGLVYNIDPASVTAGSFSTTGNITSPFTASAPVVGTVSTSNASAYTNHGDYVSANPGADAAHSCIGMPVQSQS